MIGRAKQKRRESSAIQSARMRHSDWYAKSGLSDTAVFEPPLVETGDR
jgi:hypothetical protein